MEIITIETPALGDRSYILVDGDAAAGALFEGDFDPAGLGGALDFSGDLDGKGLGENGAIAK